MAIPDVQALRADGDRVFFCRAWRTGVDGSQHAVLAVVSAEEHPTPGLVGRLAHE